MNRSPWRDEFGPMINTLRILVRSQLGYQMRHLDFKWTLDKFCDLFGRAQTVSASVRELTELATRGIFPGTAGYTVPNTGLDNSSSLTQQLFHEDAGTSNNSDNKSWKNGESGLSKKQASESSVLGFNDISKKDANIVSSMVSPKSNYYEPRLPKDYQLKALEVESLNTKNQERKVPSSRIARFAQFGQLGVGLIMGAAAEVSRRTLGFSKVNLSSV
ncbi:unnamed protein product [Wuchereria bancrofti]|uniref:Uncharacterized protein n=1 Tax=Wuchereria bancrofti TaxID=6293 RepID=A0A3P7DDS9_WUCBA|nr:unnamed protein product [Wuchereria bancrofti]